MPTVSLSTIAPPWADSSSGIDPLEGSLGLTDSHKRNGFHVTQKQGGILGCVIQREVHLKNKSR